jgi:hypothetical protein
MKLDIQEDLQDLDALLQKISAKEAPWQPTPIDLPEGEFLIELNPRDYPDITEHLFDYPENLIALAGHQCLLYIPEGILGHLAKDQPKFHFMACQTIQEMKSGGRFERYVVTNRTSGIFPVYMKNDRYSPAEKKQEIKLDVCRHCLSAYNYNNYRHATSDSKNDIVKNFDINLFFNGCKMHFENLPSRQDTSLLAGNIYLRNWPDISKSYRNSVKWHCESCGVDLSNHKSLLDTHHRDGVKTNTSVENLIALCKLCHAEQYGHAHMKGNISEIKKAIIMELRTHNNEALNKFREL